MDPDSRLARLLARPRLLGVLVTRLVELGARASGREVPRWSPQTNARVRDGVSWW